jgi:prepilin-type N-terminal cleavage/methylation domain-containing protein
MKARQASGFTLIELSIVLVVIGLIVGGILVGQSLINAAGVRATISQIEKYNSAANTFRDKYGYLPGDIPAQPAAQFGLIARGTGQGEGDGNGLIEDGACGLCGAGGEQLVFWVDLSTAGLIDGGFSAANFSTSPGSSATGPTLNLYLPQAKVGSGNYVYVISGGWGDESGTNSNGSNYFGINAVTSLGQGACPQCLWSNPGLTVQQAYAIDSKIDDGLPLTGNVLAAYIDSNNWFWPNKNGYNEQNIAPPSSTTFVPTTSTCFDNGPAHNYPMQYSIEVSNGANVNCGLTFKVQAGD